MMMMMGKQHTNATRPISDVNNINSGQGCNGISSIFGDDYNCVMIHDKSMQQQHPTTTTTTMYCFFAFPPIQSSPIARYSFLLFLFLLFLISSIILFHDNDSSMAVCQHWNQHQAQADNPGEVDNETMK